MALGVDVTRLATADSLTAGTLAAVVPRGYGEGCTQDAKVADLLHINHLMKRAGKFDIVHHRFDFLPLAAGGHAGGDDHPRLFVI